MKKIEWIILVLGASILLFFGNNSLLITDNVEANYALTAKEMVLSGDWLSPQIFGRYWFDKPIFFYWLTALSFKCFGFTEFAARFTPACFGLLTLALIAWAGTKIYNERVGFYSALILATSLEFFLISKSIVTDSVFAFFISATLIFFYLGYKDGKSSYWYYMYISAALAVLTKGPLGCLLPGIIIGCFLTFQKDWDKLQNIHLPIGLFLFFAIALPWYGLIYLVHGNEFIDVFFGIHNYLRATVSEHPKNNVFYYYPVVNILAFIPWSVPSFIVLYRKYKLHNWLMQKTTVFLLLWTSIVFILFQCFATKYITYTYPMLFPMSILLANQIANCGFMNKKIITGTAASVLLIYLILVQSVAIPFTNYRSNKDLSDLLASYSKSKTYGIYGNYPTSTQFYGNNKLVKLVPKAQRASFNPAAKDWSRKNVMPYTILENEEFQFIVVDKDAFASFQKHTDKEWQEIARVKYWLLLKSVDKL